MGLRLLAAAGFVVATAALAAEVAPASVGAGVGADPVALTQPALPGHRYRLPTLYVVNTGSVRTRYVPRIRRVPPFTNAARVPPSWVHFARGSVTLNPGEATMIALRLHVPRHARRGRYASDVLVTSAGSRSDGLTVGAGAAAALTFTVAARHPRAHRH